MEITVFAKKRTSKEGKTFYTYLGNLTRRDGTKQLVSIKFKDVKPNPEDCPLNILFDKVKANLASSTYQDEASGVEKTSYTLWVNDWRKGEDYVDTSLDDFE